MTSLAEILVAMPNFKPEIESTNNNLQFETKFVLPNDEVILFLKIPFSKPTICFFRRILNEK